MIPRAAGFHRRWPDPPEVADALRRGFSLPPALLQQDTARRRAEPSVDISSRLGAALVFFPERRPLPPGDGMPAHTTNGSLQGTERAPADRARASVRTDADRRLDAAQLPKRSGRLNPRRNQTACHFLAYVGQGGEWFSSVLVDHVWTRFTPQLPSPTPASNAARRIRRRRSVPRARSRACPR